MTPDDDEDDPFGPQGCACFGCGVHVPDGEGHTPDGEIAPGIMGRVFCPACWAAPAG